MIFMVAEDTKVQNMTTHSRFWDTISNTAVSAAREVLRIYIEKKNLTHFSGSRLDRKVL